MEKLIRQVLRKIRYCIYRLMDEFPPYVTSRIYLGICLFYTKGPGIVYRIRFLSPKPIYEEELCLSITKHLKDKDNPIFIDIGANIGLVSIYIYRAVPDVQIFSLEPGLLQRSLFGLTITKNKLENKIQLYPYAVSNSESLTSFVTYENAVDGVADGLVETGRALEKSRLIPAETITLDAFLSRYKINKVDVIKIDIEGSELLAFHGAKVTLTKHRPVVFFELNLLNLKNYKHTAEETIIFLKNLNYKIYDLHNNECSLENLPLLLQQDDTFIAIPYTK